MQIISWNINGIRAATKKGLPSWLNSVDASIIGFQEVRAKREQVPKEIEALVEWKKDFVQAERPGYSGVAVFSKLPNEIVPVSLGEEFDVEGRIIGAKFGALSVFNVYFPNGGGKNRDNGRIPYKLNFYRALFDWLQNYQKDNPRVIVMGDFNTAHKEIDIARPKANEKTSGFCPEEREEVSRWISAGWIDSFREYCTKPDQYTWWSQMFRARDRNVGWRIDYVMVSDALRPFLKDGFIHMETLGSDHCPIGIDLDDKALDFK